MDIYEARWRNAKRIAEKIIEMQEKGWLIFNANNELVLSYSIIKDNEGIESIIESGNDVCFQIFLNDKDYDAGLYTTVAEYNKQFEGWKCIDPKNIVPLPLD